MTILGQHTVAELRDLVLAKDAEMAALEKGRVAFEATWASEDPTSYAAWLSDYNALLYRYSGARTKAGAVLSLDRVNPLPDDVTPAESFYQAILGALQWKEGVVSPGDHVDLVGRIVDAGAKLNYKVPQPGAHDVDLKTYIAAGKILDTSSNAALFVALGAGLALAAVLLLRKS